MENRRQAFRKDSIEIDLGDERIIKVDPIPWEARNDFGNEVVRQHVELLNEAVRQYIDPETSAPQLEMKLAEKFSDPQPLFRLGLSPAMVDLLNSKPVFENQVIIILLAIIEINNLTSLQALIDPNSTTPTMLGTLLSEILPLGTSTQNNASGPDSSSPDSVTPPSEISLQANSSPSSTN